MATITLRVQIQVNKRPCELLPLHYLYKPGKWAVMCIVTIALPVKSQVNGRHVYCYHYTTCKKPGKWAVMCILTNTLPVQSQKNERSYVLLPLHYLYKARKNERTCVLLTLICMYKARKMSGHVYCYHYITCTKPGQWAYMCIVTITMHVQSQENERSCVLLPLHYLYKGR
jgi:hypothetical protein